MTAKSPDEILASAVESSRNIKFGRGVVSKTSYVAAFVVAVWLAVAWNWQGELSENIGRLIAGVIPTLFAVWFIRETQKFAEKNPAQALLEGAELLEWQKTEIQAKGLPPAPASPSLPGHGSALVLDLKPDDAE
jgi:hypothetical protein